MNPEIVECHRCSNCGTVYLERERAEKCCVCSACGRPITADGWPRKTLCLECWDRESARAKREKWEKAEKVRWNEYDGDGIYIEGLGPEYFLPVPSPDELVDAWESWYEDPFPGCGALMAYGVVAEPIEIAADDIEELLNGCAYEDYEVTYEMRRDLDQLCDEWNAKHGDKAYWPSNLAIVYEEES